MKLFKIGEFAQEIGVTTTTLRTWHKKEKLVPFKVSENGSRFYSEEQLLKYLGIFKKEDVSNKRTYVYARVSGSNQKDDLKNQINFLKEYANAKGYITEELSDIGSGLNYNRKNWNKLLDLVELNKVSKIIIAHKDRFIRFGFEWFDTFCKKHGCEIEVVKNESLSPEQEMVQDLISIIHVFSCRIYGLRKYKKDLREDKKIVKSI